jgi:hypothetical protein
MSITLAESIATATEPFARSRALAAEVEGTLASTEMIRAPHNEVEQLLAEKSHEWARRMLEEHMELRAAAEKRVDVVGADGVERQAARDSERHLETLFGRVAVPRTAYQAPGCEDLHPMDAALNLPRELFSFGIRRLVAKEVARASFDEVVEMVRDYKGATIAKRQVEELALRAAQDFDAFYEQRQRDAEGPPETHLLVISTDGKGVVMRHEDLRDATRLAAEKKRYKLQTRLAPGEKSDRKRMAQVAAVYEVAPWPRTIAEVLHTLRDEDTDKRRPKPHDKRVWASVEKRPRKVIREAFEDALRRDPDMRRRWVVLVDGERKQLAAVKAEARRIGVQVTILLDIVHVIEYVWKAARAIFGESTAEAEKWVSNRLDALLSGKSGGDVAGTIRWWAARRKDKLKPEAAAQVDKACKYLANRTRTRLMHYDQALRDGLPIATGVIEGACRYLVKDRMDRTGARWSLTGAEAVLRLRAIRASGDFDAYWEFHLAREKERNHAARYADAKIPDPLPARKARLRRVK